MSNRRTDGRTDQHAIRSNRTPPTRGHPAISDAGREVASAAPRPLRLARPRAVQAAAQRISASPAMKATVARPSPMCDRRVH